MPRGCCRCASARRSRPKRSTSCTGAMRAGARRRGGGAPRARAAHLREAGARLPGRPRQGRQAVPALRDADHRDQARRVHHVVLPRLPEVRRRPASAPRQVDRPSAQGSFRIWPTCRRRGSLMSLSSWRTFDGRPEARRDLREGVALLDRVGPLGRRRAARRPGRARLDAAPGAGARGGRGGRRLARGRQRPRGIGGRRRRVGVARGRRRWRRVAAFGAASRDAPSSRWRRPTRLRPLAAAGPRPPPPPSTTIASARTRSPASPTCSARVPAGRSRRRSTRARRARGRGAPSAERAARR